MGAVLNIARFLHLAATPRTEPTPSAPTQIVIDPRADYKSLVSAIEQADTGEDKAHAIWSLLSTMYRNKQEFFDVFIAKPSPELNKQLKSNKPFVDLCHDEALGEYYHPNPSFTGIVTSRDQDAATFLWAGAVRQLSANSISAAYTTHFGAK